MKQITLEVLEHIDEKLARLFQGEGMAYLVDADILYGYIDPTDCAVA